MQLQHELAVRTDEYQEFLDNRLRSDLERVIKRRNLSLEEQGEYKALQSNIPLLIQVRCEAAFCLLIDCGMLTSYPVTQNRQHSFRTLLNLGEGVHLKAEVPDTTYILVKIGLGFHAQYTLKEALALAQHKETELQHTVNQHNAEVSRLKAHMTLVGLGLRALHTE